MKEGPGGPPRCIWNLLKNSRGEKVATFPTVKHTRASAPPTNHTALDARPHRLRAGLHTRTAPPACGPGRDGEGSLPRPVHRRTAACLVVTGLRGRGTVPPSTCRADRRPAASIPRGSPYTGRCSQPAVFLGPPVSCPLQKNLQWDGPSLSCLLFTVPTRRTNKHAVSRPL